jgi:hypothetical protein
VRLAPEREPVRLAIGVVNETVWERRDEQHVTTVDAAVRQHEPRLVRQTRCWSAFS